MKADVTEMIYKKVTDSSIFTDIGTSNPMPGIMNKLREHWVLAVKSGFIPLDHACNTVGITESMVNSRSGKPSTLDIFKPGTPFFNVYPKVHKLEVDQLVPGVELPYRLVTNLSNAPTSRADRYIATNFMNDLQWDFCGDLLQDSTMFLQKLDGVDKSGLMSPNCLTFNLDVEALYDSLRRDHVELAIRDAIADCRPDWDASFIDWLIKSVNMSLDSAVGSFKGRWYQSTGGVATGGKLCVYVANITVYWSFKRVIYDYWPKKLLFLFRFIDDGTGGWNGTPFEFFKWFCRIYRVLDKEYNLRLTFNLNYCGEFMEFLDIRYRFVNGDLDTDIYYKDTDAHRYLNYHSIHPPHVFKSVVYSQFLRLRRTIIDHNLLDFRLLEMTDYFKDSDYPDKIVNPVRLDVLNKCRNLSYKKKDNNLDNKFGVGWVSTYGPGYREVRDFVAKTNKALKDSPLFSDLDVPILGVVTRRAPNLRDLLFSQKSICLSSSQGSVTTRCTALGTHKVGRPCEACDLMSNEDTVVVNGITYTCAGGDCSSFNINYFAQCVQCSKGYIGKTVQAFRTRIGQHRGFIGTLDSSTPEDLSDENTLAAHAIEHEIRTKADFNSLYKFSILRYAEKENLTSSEQFLINKFNTVRPYGLNVSNPISLPNVFKF